MNLFEVKEALKGRKLDDSFSAVYTKEQYELQYDRFLDVVKEFEAIFSAENREISLFSAPGRSEVGGNHTDHNHGKVLAASISLDVVAAASKNNDNIIRIKSAGFPQDNVDLSNLEPNGAEFGKSSALIRGIAARFKQLGYNIGGFDATTASMVLSGSGLSSSAAFEILVCTMLNHLYNGGKIDCVELAKISQFAENKFFGKPCGLLDQMACSVGGFVTIDFEDLSSPKVKKVDFDFEKCGHSLCIVDTKGDHSDLTDDYAAVRGEMEGVAEFFGKSVLRQCTKEDVIKNAAEIASKLGSRAVLRALHFYGENDKVDKEVAALESGDFETFKALIIESGLSSYLYNQNVYTPKDPKNQPLSLALAISETVLKGKGAWRVHGGGFAGTIQAFVPNDMLEEYKQAMNAVFGDDATYVLSIRPQGGVKIV